MSKRIVIINGSPTPGGNTRCLCEAVLKGVNGAGNEGIIIDLASLSIAPYSGPSQAEDDMSKVTAEIRTADAVVIASPLYWMQFTGQLKVWMDRLSTVGKDALAGKETALVACAASPAEVIEKNLLGYYRMCFIDSLGWKDMVLSVKLISARSVDLFSGVFQLFSCPVELFYTFQSDSLR